MKKFVMSLLLILISISMYGFKKNESVDVRKITPGPYKYVCDFEYCPAHIVGTPDCYESIRRDLYFCSFEGNISTTSDVEDIKPYFKKEKFYTVTNKINSDNFLQEGDLMYTRINRKYFFISSHGSYWGRVYFSPNTYYKAKHFPNMDNTEVALFSICYGGANKNAADYVVKYKGVKNAIGWKTTIGVNSARLFTTHFWRILMEDEYGQSIEEVVRKTLDYISPYIYGELAERILNPILYRKGKEPMNFSGEKNIKNYKYLNGHKIINNSHIFTNSIVYNYNESEHNLDVITNEIDKIVNNSKIFNTYDLLFEESLLVRIENSYHLIYKYNCHFKGEAESILTYYLDVTANKLLDNKTINKILN